MSESTETLHNPELGSYLELSQQLCDMIWWTATVEKIEYPENRYLRGVTLIISHVAIGERQNNGDFYDEPPSNFDPEKRYTLRIDGRKAHQNFDEIIPQEITEVHTLECEHCGAVKHTVTRIEPSRIAWRGGIKKGDYAFYFSFPEEIYAER